MLNELGYYRIASMKSSTEVLSVLRHAVEAFDLVIANRALASNTSIDFCTFCQDHPLVRHLLIYDCPEPVFTSKLSATGVINHTSLSHPPDSHSIRCLMREIDSRL